ncbi:MAG: type II toxin-antitoxin system Phd/YefM family antitoxin [Thermomicrobiales bacterium]
MAIEHNRFQRPTRTVSSNDAKQNWGSVIGSVSAGEDEVIVESHGKPKVVVISFEEYKSVQELREKQRRAALLERFRALSERIGNRNNDLTDQQIDELSNRFSHEFIEDLAREGKIRFEYDIEP